MAGPLISVVVFTRNAASTLDRALQSVCTPGSAQTEVLVLDGGSTDATVAVIDKYRHAIAYARSRPDGGPTNAINEGVGRARGEVICLLPGDDWLESEALPFIANEFSQDQELDVLTCGARIVRTDASGAVHTWAEYRDESHLAFTLPNILRNPLTCARFIRKRVYDKLGGMDDSWTLPDKEFLVRVYFSNVRSKTHGRLVYNFRRHSGSATNSGRPEMTIRMLEQNIRLSRHYLPAPGMSAEDRTALLRLHGGSSARLALMSGIRGHLAEAGATLAAAFHTDPGWALDALAWYYDSAQEKLRNARAR
jgi:glycosyltransferase involved in cell wall biosynthesis